VQISALALRDADVLRLDAPVELTTEPQLVLQSFSLDIPEQAI
jgi:hypothetical protein